MAGLLILRSVRWAPVLLTLGTAAAFLAFTKHPQDAVGAFVVLIPVGVAWVVDDPAATLTASARWGRRPQLVARCLLAVVLAALTWAAAVWWAGAAPADGTLILGVLLAVALAGSITWGAAYGGPATALVWAATQAPPERWQVRGDGWWPVAFAGVCWLVIAARDPERR